MAAQRDKEPSMEEILASIRRIITDEEAPPAGTIAVPEPQAQAADDERFMTPPADILELTEPLPEPVAGPTLLSEATAAVTSQSLTALSSLMVRGYDGADNTLEGLVRELLKPMLREWLDANLPELVEAMVSREIRRLTRRD